MAFSIGDYDDSPYCDQCGRHHEPEVGFGCPYNDLFGRPFSKNNDGWVDIGQKQLNDAKEYKELNARRREEEYQRKREKEIKEWRGGLWFKDLIDPSYSKCLKKLHEKVFKDQGNGWTWVSGKARIEGEALVIERDELGVDRLFVLMTSTMKLSHKIVSNGRDKGVVIRTSQIDNSTFKFKVKYEGRMLPLEVVQSKCNELFRMKEELSQYV